ncbi:hypothetical protein LSH36_1296g00000 [Paralvinella palmiformis]|uniref:Uncharacterized protein n=1 Tax=Paralvinella palmiformis TaxID=53620 RepID=A0AAD9MRQ4_9ANNE|nr:hypothetical protein LSH36_1296g00000 [Paralvinella palmiformis]
MPGVNVKRSFYAYWYHKDCPKDMGWSVVLDESSGYCPWEQNNIRPSFMYCSESDPCLYTKSDEQLSGEEESGEKLSRKQESVSNCLVSNCPYTYIAATFT